MTIQTAQTKVLDLLSEINRPGIDSVIEFITIYTDGSSATSIADYIDDLHSLIEIAGDEIDSLIDIRA